MYSINKVHFYDKYIPISDFCVIKNESLFIVKYVLMLEMQDVFENMRCLDLSNTTILSPFAM